MESHLNVPNVDISLVRRYSLAELESIDFSSSDDLAVVVDKLKNIITLEKNIENIWTEEQEQLLWQFAIDPDSFILTCYFFKDSFHISSGVPKVPVSELFYFIKIIPEKLISSDYSTKLIYGSVKEPIFESIYILFSSLYGPMFFKSNDWSQCIKSDYQHHLTKFSSKLFQLKNDLSEQIILYVPEEILDKNIDFIVENKSLLNQVEKAVMGWIWSIVSVLMKRANIMNGYVGPLEEIKFWETRLSDLDDILKQLNRQEVKLCIGVLKTANLASFHKLDELYLKLQEEWKVTADNIKYLSLLKPTCKALQESPLSEIPDILSELLDLVRIIWKNSLYFNDNIAISSLISKANNFSLKIISSFVPLDEIFTMKSSDEKLKIVSVICCCQSWLEIFDYSEKVHKKYSEATWSVESVAPVINLFIHRCEELIEICDYKLEFTCNISLEKFAQGHECSEIIKQFKMIENNFYTALNNLSKSRPVILDINKAEWYDFYKR